jgi:hypothetical protein
LQELFVHASCRALFYQVYLQRKCFPHLNNRVQQDIHPVFYLRIYLKKKTDVDCSTESCFNCGHFIRRKNKFAPANNISEFTSVKAFVGILLITELHADDAGFDS